MLEIMFFLIIAAIITGVPAAILYWKQKYALAYAIGAGGVLLFILAYALFNVNLVKGGQVGVSMKGDKVTTFSGFKITTLGTKIVVFDRSIPLDLNVELDPNGVPTDQTVILVTKDGSQVFLDARAVLALDSLCGTGPRRCVSKEDKDRIAALAIQFRKDGQDALTKYATAKMRERANLVASGYPTADEMINQQRPRFLSDFTTDVTDNLSALGLTPTVLVVEQLVPSAQTQERLNAIATERANTAQRGQEALTALEVAKRQKTEADTAAYSALAAAKAEAEGIAARGQAYAANPQAAEVDMAKAYGSGGNAVVVTNGQAEVRPIVTTGAAGQ
jgi:SPFH domain / Band 7 family